MLLAVCGGYQLLGNYYRTKEETIEGLGILDIYTEWGQKRLVHDIVLDSPLFARPIVGFENHGGRTYINGHTPFGKVRHGYGNTGTSGYEGVMFKHIIATYLHGPLLPKNPDVCDYLLSLAIKQKYGGNAGLPPLPDNLEHMANDSIARQFQNCYFPKKIRADEKNLT